MKRFACFTIRLAVTWLFTYLWVFTGSEGAFNVLRFLVIGLAIVSFLMMAAAGKPTAEMLALKPTPRLLVWLDVLTDLVLMIVFAWAGYFGVALALVISMACVSITRAMLRAARAKAAATSATAAA